MIEQLSLLSTNEEELSNKILGVFNSLDTRWKGTFVIDKVELEHWLHIKSKNKVLSIILKTTLDTEDNTNCFTYINDEEDTVKLHDELSNNELIEKLYKDEDFSINLSPHLVHIFFHNFDVKNLEDLF